MVKKTARSCIDIAYSLLSRREHSRSELYRKLRSRNDCDEDDIDNLLDELENENLLSDERYTEMAVRSGLQRGHGRLKIRHKLRENGIASSLVTIYLDQADIDWYAHIHDVRLRKIGEELPQDYKERAKLSRFLAGRGFETEMIRAELDL